MGANRDILDYFLDEITVAMQTPAWIAGDKEARLSLAEKAKDRALEKFYYDRLLRDLEKPCES